MLTPPKPTVFRWIKAECGRNKYQELAERRGLFAKIRLYWFVLFAAIRDAKLP
jgi:hypothetical protein